MAFTDLPKNRQDIVIQWFREKITEHDLRRDFWAKPLEVGSLSNGAKLRTLRAAFNALSGWTSLDWGSLCQVDRDRLIFQVQKEYLRALEDFKQLNISVPGWKPSSRFVDEIHYAVEAWEIALNELRLSPLFKKPDSDSKERGDT